MNLYEITLIIGSNIDEDRQNKIIKDIEKIIIDLGGSIKNIDNKGETNLSYEIKKVKKGYYYFIHFNCDPAKIKELDNKLRIMPDILRHFVVSEK